MLALVAIAAAAIVASAQPGAAATAGSVVGATVPSSTQLDASGCRSGEAGRTSLGLVPPGSAVIGSQDCTITFGSSNDTARLGISQGDASGAALETMTPTNSRLQDDHRFYDVDAFSSSLAWAVGTSGQIRRWNGSDWSVVSSGFSATMRGVAVGSTNQVVWTAGTNATIRRTTNGGSSWPSQTTGSGTLNGIDAWNDSIAVAVGVGGIGRYTADGSTWNVSTTNTTDTLEDLVVLSASIVVAAGRNGRIIRSTDGGATFTPVASSTAADLFAITARDATTLYAAGSSTVVKSIDAGLTWAPLAGVPTYSHEGIVAEGAQGLLTVTTGGRVLRSTDDGGSWNTVQTYYQNDLQAATLLGTRTFIAGYGSMLGHSDDAGASWSISPLFRPSMNDVYATSNAAAWAVGSRGSIRVSTDGTTMTDQASGTIETLEDIDGVDDQTLWAVGDNGTILATTDGGGTWSAQTSGVTWDVRAVDAVDEHTAWAAGDNSASALRTVNGGQAWVESTAPGSAYIYSVSAGSRDVAWIGGSSAYLARTTNGGTTWTQITLPGAFGSQTIHVGGADSSGQRAVVLGSAGSVYRTTDGGASWTAVAGADGVVSSGNGIDAHDTNAMALAVQGGNIHYSADGVTWTTAPAGSPTRANTGVSYPSTQAVWSSADSYAVLRTDAPTGAVPDYGDDPADLAGTDWGTPGASFFGACLRALASATAVDWAVDGDGTCGASDADPWRPIVATGGAAGSQVARTTTVGATGTASIRFGLRAASSLPAGDYAGTARIEVVAPGV